MEYQWRRRKLGSVVNVASLTVGGWLGVTPLVSAQTNAVVSDGVAALVAEAEFGSPGFIALAAMFFAPQIVTFFYSENIAARPELLAITVRLMRIMLISPVYSPPPIHICGLSMTRMPC